jgi:hypothetical protein
MNYDLKTSKNKLLTTFKRTINDIIQKNIDDCSDLNEETQNI